MNTFQSNTSKESSYAMKSASYWCGNCNRKFSNLQSENSDPNAISRAQCPRCDNYSNETVQQHQLKQPRQPQNQPQNNQQTQQTPPQAQQQRQQQQQPQAQAQSQAQAQPQSQQNQPTQPQPSVNNPQAPNVAGNMNLQNAQFTPEQAPAIIVLTREEALGPQAGPTPSTYSLETPKYFLLIADPTRLNANGYPMYMRIPVIDERDLEEMLTRLFGPNGPKPASQEVIDKLPEVKYDPKKGAESHHTSCPICYEDYKEEESLVEMPCKHEFHKKCVESWLKKNNSCPMCRKAL